ncbi:hypothetical protein [Heyndrickxia ginsengihumi]|uniref:hypothetical protein n=1 Tax=Heyndrickxia ginsengihumi TaxID=363870 RepID=UPI00046EFBF1|nr:hypothetical protein [Heyndrickxia ginsengihumi]
MQGWIKLHRKILEHDIWNDVSTFRLFTFLLLKAAHKDGVKVNGIELKEGQYLRSYRKLADDLSYKEGRGLKKYSISTIKRCFVKLIENGMVTVRETELGTLITIVNYASYQQLSDAEVVSRNASQNEVRTKSERTQNNNKNEKNEKKERRGDGTPETESKISPEDKRKRVDAVSTRYLNLRNRGFYLSPEDQNSIDRVCDLDIDLETLLTWIDEIFKEHAKSNPYDYIRKFKYCETGINTKYRARNTNIVPFGSSKPKPKQESLEERWKRLKAEGKLRTGGN